MIRKVQPPKEIPYEPPAVPAWAMPRGAVDSDLEAAFMAGAALNVLDNVVRAQPSWIGAWRQRLALKCAVSAVRLAGRSEDEASLRDALLLRKPGDDPGPAGNILFAWKRLASRSTGLESGLLREIVDLAGLRWSDDLAVLPEQAEELLQSTMSAPFAAASIFARVHAIRPDAELLGWWLADWMLAQKMRWPVPAPLLMAQRYGSAFRVTGGRGRVGAADDAFARAVCVALAQAAGDACRSAMEIARKANHLAVVMPKLRAKGAGEAIRMLLDDDAVSGSFQTAKLSRWASRRLFERLIEYDAVRELSGRSTFRIYGL